MHKYANKLGAGSTGIVCVRWSPRLPGPSQPLGEEHGARLPTGGKPLGSSPTCDAGGHPVFGSCLVSANHLHFSKSKRPTCRLDTGGQAHRCRLHAANGERRAGGWWHDACAHMGKGCAHQRPRFRGVAASAMAPELTVLLHAGPRPRSLASRCCWRAWARRLTHRWSRSCCGTLSSRCAGPPPASGAYLV